MDNAAKIPEWALREAIGSIAVFRMNPGYDDYRDAFARLLVSTREAALSDLSRIFLAKWGRHGAEFSVDGVMLDAVDAAKEPS